MTLATEPPDLPDAPATEEHVQEHVQEHVEEHVHVSPHERWAENERMRHIPQLSWIIPKLDSDLRRRIDLLWSACANVSPEHPLHNAIDHEFRGLSRSIERVGDVARRARSNHHHPPAETGARLRWTLNHTISMLNSVDSATFGRRFPFQTFERSNAEPLWAAMLAVIEHVHRLTDLARPIDPSIDERIYEGLVTLQTPLDARPM